MGEKFSEMMFWKAKLNAVNRNLKEQYEKDRKLRVKMYNPYFHELEKAMTTLQEAISKCLMFCALLLHSLIEQTTVVPDTYPKTASVEEDLLYGLSDGYYITGPVKIGNYKPLDKETHYVTL